ncbi:MAG: MFS transporter, partial [Propionibacteriaceae bacterium]|nr:MFS transporter [Propionibacteriaceae bacterium]
LGWEWIFFVNIPFGALAIILVLAWVPEMPTHSRHFDLVGIGLSAVGLFLLVYGIQQGESHSWGPDVWAMILGGFAVMCAFVWWQSRVRTDPLVPLRIFRDRNFSLGNTSIATMGFAVAGTMVPFMFYLQQVKGLSAISSGLMLLPMAVLAGLLAPLVGRLSDRFDPRIFTGIGFLSFAVALLWLWSILDADTSIPALLAPISLMGVANGTVWAPNSSTAMRQLDTRVSGAGSGVYNTTRQVGAVLGSAGIGAVMQTRLTATGDIATSVGDAMLLPAALLLLGGLATMFFRTGPRAAAAPQPEHKA